MYQKKYAGIYLVSETGCLNPASGAYKHIIAGLSQLQKHFYLETVFFCKPFENNAESNKTIQKRSVVSSKIFQSLKQSLKWFYILLRNHKNLYRHYKQIKETSPGFIYERASYLNYNGLLIAKWLNIPHMFEVNGVLAHDNSKYFPRILNKLSYLLEKQAYKRTFGFYVGGINEVFGIYGKNQTIIQNGIEQEFVSKFANKQTDIRGKINLTFVGHAMDHHRLDILTDALGLIERPELFSLHLVGSNLQSLKEDIPNSIETKFYGNLSQDRIADLLQEFHLGIITHAMPYFSHVKVFMYGAAKLAVVLPRSKNFINIFDTDEAIFIENGNAEDIAAKLDTIAENPEILKTYGEKLHMKIKKMYTWEDIYNTVSNSITQIIEHGVLPVASHVDSLNMKN